MKKLLLMAALSAVVGCSSAPKSEHDHSHEQGSSCSHHKEGEACPHKHGKDKAKGDKSADSKSSDCGCGHHKG